MSEAVYAVMYNGSMMASFSKAYNALGYLQFLQIARKAELQELYIDPEGLEIVEIPLVDVVDPQFVRDMHDSLNAMESKRRLDDLAKFRSCTGQALPSRPDQEQGNDSRKLDHGGTLLDIL